MPGSPGWGQTVPPIGTPLNPGHPMYGRLVGAWLLNGSAGIMWEATTGTPGVATAVAARFGGASFDGATAWINAGVLPRIRALTRPTIMSRVYFVSLPAGETDICGHVRTNSANGFGFGRQNSHLQYVTWGVKAYFSTDFMTTDRWWDVAVIHDANDDANFFANGAALNIDAGTATATVDTDDNFAIGATSQVGVAPPARFFDGIIQYLYIFTDPVAPTDVLDLMADPYALFVAPVQPALVKYQAPAPSAKPWLIARQMVG